MLPPFTSSCDRKEHISVSSIDSIEFITLEECAVSFINKLDASAIFAPLAAQHLLTEDDKQVIISDSWTPREKAKYIIHILPRKAHGWFDKLLQCLHESADGTGHGDLLRELDSKRQKLIERRSNSSTKLTSGNSQEPSIPVGSRPEEVRRRGESQQEEVRPLKYRCHLKMPIFICLSAFTISCIDTLALVSTEYKVIGIQIKIIHR